MPLEPRLLSIGAHLPGALITNEELAPRLRTSAEEVARRTGIARRHHAPAGEGPSDLARRAADDALRRSGTEVSDLALIVFATATPDVTFPGSACYLQDKLGADTVGALDVRAQSAGFLAALDLALALSGGTSAFRAPASGETRILVAAGEVFSTGLDESPSGADLTPRLADGAAAAVVGPGEAGSHVRALRWYSDGTLADRFWCEYPASRQYPLRVTAENLAAGLHYPKADFAALAPIVEKRLFTAMREVLELAGWSAGSVEAAFVDYVEPPVARAAASAAGLASERVDVPTERFGHVMAAGLPIRFEQRYGELAPGARVLLAAAGPGVTWGAAAIEIG
ncbi:MAG: hypothetical protein FJ144_08835 [Deltaproteobacteria bacterium]|nr:hypothetical protein [Deltaproteobacteria bacterium]